MLNKKWTIERTSILLMCLYVFVSYIAVDIWVSSTVNSIVLYAFVGLGAIFIVYKFLKDKVKIPAFSIWYLVFMIVSIITMLYSPEQNILSGQFYLMIVSFLLTFLYLTFIRTESHVMSFAWAFVIGSLFLNVMLLSEGMLTGSAGDRLGSEIMGNANNFARMIMVATMYAMWLLIHGIKKADMKTEKGRKSVPYLKVLLVAIILFDIYALIMSAGRSFFIIPFVFAYVLLIYNKPFKKIICYTALFACFVVFVYVLIMEVPEFYEAIGVRFEGLLGSAEGTQIDNSAQMRDTIRALAFNRWMDSPIFGFGFDSFKYYAQEKVGHFYYSHCNYAEMLYNGGIVLFAVYYWMYIKLAIKIKKAKNVSVKYRAFALATLLAYLVFDYAAISYGVVVSIAMFAIAFKMLTFEEKPCKINGKMGKTDMEV